ncbi:MAG TPA: hypothetical protein DEO99_03300 [Bacteroidetes bacterium]|nr:hypothetical protein [Bacteroidota bacterium]
MAVMQSRDTRSFVAGESLAAAQFKFVTLESDGQVDLADSAGENCIGVLLNNPAAGEAATVAISGKVMVTSGGTIAAGAAIQTDANGDALTAASGDVVMGYALEAAVDGQIMAIELIQGGNVVA